jgi:hypothetical protein
MEGRAKGWSVGRLLLRGEGGTPEPLSLWGEMWFFRAVGGDEACQGGFVVRGGMEG